MSIKNTFKLLFNRFGIVWEILLFLVIFLIVFCGLGAIYIQPVIQVAVDLRIHESVMSFYDTLLSGQGFAAVMESIKGIFGIIRNIFINDDGIVLKTFVVPFLFFVTFNLFFNMHELPLCKVLEARMSSNAKLSLMNNVISLSGKSVLYVLAKLLFALVADGIIFLALWGSYRLMLHTSLPLLIPFVVLLVLILFMSLKNCFIVTCEQNIIIGEKKIFPALAQSIRDGFKHFGTTFSSYFICFILSFAITGLLALLTFGVGLIIFIPVNILFFKLLQMTAYYTWNGKRYYLDGNRIIGPEKEQILTDKLN